MLLFLLTFDVHGLKLMKDYEYIYDPEKNTKLKEERGVNFEDVILALEHGKFLDLIPHHNPSKYITQDILVVEINHYIYLVPCVQQENILILKTVYPSRRATALYLKNRE
jgi:hypothetical protein